MRLQPARIEADADGLPHAPAFGDRYHGRIGAQAQAQAVFLAGNGLPARWAGRDDYTILETGFGLGHNFLATCRAWRADPARPARLHYVAIEAHPPQPDDLRRWHPVDGDGPPDPALQALLASWPPPIAGWHRVDLEEGGAVRLLLAWGDVQAVLRELDVEADALYMDGFAPDRNPAMWSGPVLQALARRLRPGGTAATWSVARPVREGLRAAGFAIQRQPGPGDKREVLQAVLAPAFDQRRPPPRGSGGGDRHALVLGAGLAGAWTAHTLARAGWSVTVRDRHPAPAQGASGNPGGLFHATVHADDGIHARFSRHAALRAASLMAPWFDAGVVPGRHDGLLRLAAEGESAADLRAQADAAAWPEALVRVLDATEASAWLGHPVDRPGYLFVQAGWADPAALVGHLLDTPGVRFEGGTAADSLVRADGRWQLRDRHGRPLDEAGTVVLANGADAARLWPAAGWPLGQSRGQLSLWQPDHPGLPTLRHPLAGDGYALRLADGRLLAGATAQHGDRDPDLRETDHRFNRARLQRLTGWDAPAPDGGRVGWRCQAPDRLPLAGPVPVAGTDVEPRPGPLQARRLAREPGLFVLTGLGSRGLTWAPLASEMLAAWITGLPMPVPARLRDALDPARWRLRELRRAGRPASAQEAPGGLTGQGAVAGGG